MIIYLFILNIAYTAHIGVVSENRQKASLQFIQPDNIFSIESEDRFLTHQNKSLRQFSIWYNDQTLLTYQEGQLSTEKDFIIQKNINVADFNNRIYFMEQEQPILWYFEHFQDRPDGWSDRRVSQCGTSSNIFLGGPCNFGNQIVSKTIKNIPPHSKLIINFNFHFFDDWEGETAILKLDEQTVWVESYKWCDKVMPWMCYKFGINICGNDIPDQMGQFVETVYHHQKDSITIEFSNTIDKKDACQASWGIDNLQIYLV